MLQNLKSVSGCGKERQVISFPKALFAAQMSRMIKDDGNTTSMEHAYGDDSHNSSGAASQRLFWLTPELPLQRKKSAKSAKAPNAHLK